MAREKALAVETGNEGFLLEAGASRSKLE